MFQSIKPKETYRTISRQRKHTLESGMSEFKLWIHYLSCNLGQISQHLYKTRISSKQ